MELEAEEHQRFKKSSYSESSGCVEVAFNANGTVGVRDSKDPDGPVLVFTPIEWIAFLKGLHNGEFDISSSGA